MKKSRCLVGRFALATILAGLSVGAAQAQSYYSARFTLPFEVHWGAATLPAGEYSLAMSSIEGPLNVSDAQGRIRVRVYGTPDSPTRTQPTSLLITRDGADRVVRSFNCQEWGRKFVYLPITRAEQDLLASGERVETVTVRMASR
jgi:hypothetical protein